MFIKKAGYREDGQEDAYLMCLCITRSKTELYHELLLMQGEVGCLDAQTVASGEAEHVLAAGVPGSAVGAGLSVERRGLA